MCHRYGVARVEIETLQRVPLFSGIDRKELESIAKTMRERTFPAGSTVTAEGAGGAGFFVVAEGEGEVTVHGEPRGKLGPGDYFGEIALLTGSDRTATITATTDMRCYGMTPWEFRPLVESNSAIAWKLLQTMAQRLSS
jgi:CRP/FNR family cyclic AMP-dependent transcriptional regulator